MKKILRYSLPLLLLFFLLVSCQQEELETSEENFRDSSHMNINNMVAGQQFQYVVFSGEGPWTTNDSEISYTGDTIVIKVLEVLDENKYLMSSRFTEGSPRKDWTTSPCEGEELGTQIWEFKDKRFIRTKGAGDFFFRWGVYFDFIHVDTSYIEMKKWNPGIPFREEDSFHYVEDFVLLGNFYDRLDIAVNHDELIYHYGEYHMYSEKYGMIRFCSYIRGAVFGLDKL